jgi:hypothetical protein
MKSTNLHLSEPQETQLSDYLIQRFSTLKSDNEERIRADKESWDRYLNRYTFRKKAGTIFTKSNFSIPMTSLIVDYFVTRSEDDLLGTSPYLTFNAQGGSDTKKAQDYDRYFRWKLETNGKTRSRLELANLHSFVQRSAILKATYVEHFALWSEDGGAVLFDTELDLPIQSVRGPIIKGVTQMVTTVDEATGQTVIHPKDDPLFNLNNPAYSWKSVTGLEFKEILERGPRSVLVDYNAFFCPSNAASVDDADITCELYDKPLSWVKSMWLDARPWAKWEDYQFSRQHGDASAKTEKASTPKNESLTFDDLDPLVPIREFWVRRDILGTGVAQDFCVFVDAETNKVIWYEYAAKITPDMRRPYTAIAVGRTSACWWGPSLVERIAECQDYIDRQFNGISFRNELASNPITGVNPQALQEEPDDIEIVPGKAYETKPGKSINDFVSFAAIPQVDGRTKELMDFVIYMLQLWLGVSNLAQGDYAKTPMNSTATGVEASLRESSKMGRRWMRRVIEGFESHLTKLTKLAIVTMDVKETYEYMEGDVKTFADMTIEDVRNLDVDVQLVLSQNQSQRQIETADAALKVQERYLNTPAPMRPVLRPLLVQLLQGLGFKNVDDLLPAPEKLAQIEQEMAAMQQAQLAAQAQQGMPPGAAPEQANAPA